MTEHSAIRMPADNGSGLKFFRPTALRATLLLEYVSLLIFCLGIVGTVTWLPFLRHGFVPLLMTLAGLWLTLRAMGFLSGSGVAVFLTALLSMLCLAASGLPPSTLPDWLCRSPVSPTVWVVTLAVVLLFDFIDVRHARVSRLTDEQRRKWDARFLLLVIVSAVFLWGVGLPLSAWFRSLQMPLNPRQLEQLSLGRDISFRFSEAFVTVCFALLGANIGSFLNVVVWRLPRGESIVSGDSHCPACGAGIRRSDNLPVFGWLRLGGRCRDCGVGISSRYPTVEAITAFVFLVFYFAQLISGGASLPFRPINTYRGVLWIIMYAKWDLIGLYLYHCSLFCVLLVQTLMIQDGAAIPRRLMVFALGLMGLPQIFVPDLLLVSPLAPFRIQGTPGIGHLWQVVLTIVAAPVIAALLTWLLRRLVQDSQRSPWELFWFPLCLISLARGWQAAVMMSLLLTIASVIIAGRRQSAARTARVLLTLQTLHFLVWRLEWSVILSALSLAPFE